MAPQLRKHQATTRNLGAIYPFMAQGPLSDRGIVVGTDVYTSGSFLCDEFELYRQNVIQSTNKVIFGVIGIRKSTYVKTMAFRHLVFGRTVWILDPKNEYDLLARAVGVKPIRLRPHGGLRLNPLDPMYTLGELPADDVFGQQLGVLAALVEGVLGRDLREPERTALYVALERVVGECERPAQVSLEEVRRALRAGQGLDQRGRIQPTIPMVVEAMVWPASNQGHVMNQSPEELIQDGKDVAHALRRFVGREQWGGMFDGPTSRGIDLGGPMVVIDLSAVYNDRRALGLVMACAMAWLRRALEARRAQALKMGRSQQTIVVIDEAWACLRSLEVARWLLDGIKLSRNFGASYWLVFHKLSDLGAVGAEGSEQVRLVESLYADIQVRVIYRQERGEAHKQRERFGLTSREMELAVGLRPGVGIHQVAGRSFLVQHVVSPQELPLVNTDHAMRSQLELEAEAAGVA
jgi:hypothetical protein